MSSGLVDFEKHNLMTYVQEERQQYTKPTPLNILFLALLTKPCCPFIQHKLYSTEIWETEMATASSFNTG